MSWREHAAAPAPGTVLARIEDVPDGGARELVLGEGPWPLRLVLVRRGDRLWAYVNACPHRGLSLDAVPGRFPTAEKTWLDCANHGARFRFDDGVCVAGPCTGRALEAVPIRIERGTAFVAASGAASDGT